MCTAFVSIEPSSAVPVLLLSVRDEYAGRRWSPPDHHWPGRPTVVGGLDLAAGGTWLAVEPGADPLAACLLNGFGAMAPARGRLSRGELPLTAVRDGGIGHLDLTRYDPFHLVVARSDGARVLSWGGSRLEERELPSGLSVVLNDGLEGAAADRTTSELVRSLMAARAARFRARFGAAERPLPLPDAGTTEQAWGAWLPIVSGDGLALDDPAALIQRRDFGDGRIWGSSSISLLAFGPTGVRYDFGPAPVGDPADDAWRRIV
ncbi:NRDE family protein [Kitasatospora sp. RG8]|uniref:NRDE family protein n=1 Tax=Kitasatospora sp. RG8 TaxID=2820815 RepID=UPI001ADF70B6|nr:NRDE family protein [Kitasatospora sp. RG8]MBP0451876.1 NRDE family protein [Kitasatospora sp. RG8]